MRCPAAFHESRMEDQVYLDRISLFCQSIGVPKTIPRIHLTEDEIKSAPFCKDYACLVLRTSTISRDYYDMEGLFKLLDIPIVVVDHEKTILNSRSTAGMSIRQTCAVIKNSRMVITPDTGWLHVAGALKKPIFGLFGNMPAEFRQAPYQVAGGWHQGRCTQGRTSPCWYRICKKDEFTPCMRTPVEMIAGHIRSTWDSLYS